ncbi:hypothetical protein D322_518 [Yersinia enterocolitica IP 10393]|nr:hypothetical protein D322_518 [Yersinia enterocolitica IP 10393]
MWQDFNQSLGISSAALRFVVRCAQISILGMWGRLRAWPMNISGCNSGWQ